MQKGMIQYVAALPPVSPEYKWQVELFVVVSSFDSLRILSYLNE